MRVGLKNIRIDNNSWRTNYESIKKYGNFKKYGSTWTRFKILYLYIKYRSRWKNKAEECKKTYRLCTSFLFYCKIYLLISTSVSQSCEYQMQAWRFQFCSSFSSSSSSPSRITQKYTGMVYANSYYIYIYIYIYISLSLSLSQTTGLLMEIFFSFGVAFGLHVRLASYSPKTVSVVHGYLLDIRFLIRSISGGNYTAPLTNHLNV